MPETIKTPENNQATVWSKLKDIPFNEERSITERKFIKLENLESILNAEKTYILGHGTGTAGNSHDVVSSILTDGLMGYQSLDNMASEFNNPDKAVGSTDLSSNTIVIYPFGDEQKTNNIARLKERLNHWEHRDAKNIILIRLPFDYFNMHSEFEDEKDSPFFVQKRDNSGQMRNYLDPRFIIGNYDRETGLVEMNEQFEFTISDEFQKEMNLRLAKAEEKTDARHNLENQNDFSSKLITEDGYNDNSDAVWTEQIDEDDWE